MHEIQIFNHEEFGEIRTVEIDGQIYFVGVDVAKALQYSDPIGAVRKRVDEEDRMVLSKKFCREFLSSQNSHLENIPNRGLTIINESGLYSLVLASKLQGAKKFKHWVTSEVLPAIRKTGSYNPNPPRLEYNPYIYIETVNVEKFVNQGEIVMKENQNNRRKIGERTHIYKNANGSIFGKKVINKFSDGSKNAIWYLFNPETNNFYAKAGLSGATAPLYNADILHHNQDNLDMPVLIVEGEKDVETLANMEILATSLPNGGQSRQWHDLYNDGLQNHDIIILTDNDKTGETYGENVAKNVSRIARSVKIIPAKTIWNDCPEKGDISDIAEALGQDKTIAQLLDATRKAEYYADISEFEELIKDNSEAFQKKPLEYQFITLSNVQEKPIDFIWYPYIPIGEITIMFATGGTGKSFLTCGIAADISAGRSLPIPNYIQGQIKPENVLFISAEDSASVLKQRIFVAGGDISKCHCLAPPDTPEELENYCPFKLPFDSHDTERIQAFEQVIANTKAKLVIIDPWAAYIGKDTDMNRANSIRAITAVLVVIAKKMGCAILVVAHVNKKAQADNANDAVSGSVDLINSARSALAVRTLGDSNGRVMVHTKCNYEALGKSVCYQIINQGRGRTGKFEWDGFCEITKEDLENSARTGKKLKDIADDKYDEELNKQTAIDVITDLSVCGAKINVTFSRFRTEIKNACGVDFLPSKPTRFMNSLISDLRTRGITLEKIGRKTRDDIPDGTKPSMPYAGFVICRMTDGHLMADAMPR
ncbi:MAG: AAA family ATPase [Oscillospiraceae bacterium]|nr:AAA family ATPase [Oscillospiraceae bacterium]